MTMLKNIKKINSDKYFLLYAFLIFFTPLIFVTNTNELFEFPKMYFVYFVALLIGTIFSLEEIENTKKLQKVSLPVLFFVGTFVISTIMSSHLYTSVWGYYTRFNDGLVSVFAFITLYSVAKNKLSVVDFDGLFQISLFTIIPISIYAISQHFGIGDLAWSSQSTDRAFSTFGQPNWLAQHMVMILPFCFYHATLGRNKNIWFVMYSLGFPAFWFAYSMSGIIAFVASFTILFLFHYRKLFSATYFPRVLALVLFTIAIAITNMSIFSGKFKDAIRDVRNHVYQFRSQNFVFAQEFQDDSNSDAVVTPNEYAVSDPGFIRIGLWKGTLNMITATPKNFFVGTGPETYPYAFQFFRPTSLNYSSEWNYVFNKPHNYYLELWSEQGLLGLVSYSALLLWAWNNLSKDIRPGLLGFIVTNFFGWPVVATAMLFWFWVAYAEKKNNL